MHTWAKSCWSIRDIFLPIISTRIMFRDRPFWGTPIYFYLVFMAIKIPLLVLVSFIVGFVVSIKRRVHPGHAFVLFMFLFWIVPYSLIGAKWLRYTLSLMPFVYMLAAIGVVELIRFTEPVA